MGTVGYMAVMVMAPVIRVDLAINAAQFGLFMSAYFAAQIVTALPAGIITDRLGVGWSLVLSMVLIALGISIFATATVFEAGLLAMFTMGLGYTLVNPATAKGVLDWFPRRRRATAIGVKQLGVPLGGLLGAGAGALVVLVDWRMVMAIPLTAALITGAVWIPFAQRPVRGSSDWASVWTDLRIVLGNRRLGIICGANAGINIGYSSFLTFTALFIRDAAAASQTFAGLCFACAQVAATLGRVGYGVVSDTLFQARRKGVIVALLLVSFVFFASTLLVTPSWPAWALVGLVVALGGTIGAYAPLIIALSVESSEAHLSGATIGYNGLAWSAGGVIGPPLFGLILDSSGSYGQAWLVVGLIVLVAALVLHFGFNEGEPVS